MLDFKISRRVEKHLLEFNASLPQQPGLFVALYGENGGGKSLLLDMLAGIERPDSGRIYFGEKCFFDTDKHPRLNLVPEARRVGYAFQDQRLFPHKNIEANLRYAAQVQGKKRQGKKQQDKKQKGKKQKSSADFDEIVEALALGDLLTRYPPLLSGGEQQRVALGRALLSSPQLLLLDEPLSSVDSRHKRRALRLLGSWAKQRAVTVLYVSHDIEESAGLATHAMTVSIEAKGSAQVRSRIAACDKIEAITTRIETSQEIGASDLAIIPAYLGVKRAVDGLWSASLGKTSASLGKTKGKKNKLDCRFELSTNDGKPPPMLCEKQRITYVRIRAEDVLLATAEDPRAFRASLQSISAKRNDGRHTAQLICGEQRLLIKLTPRQTQSLKRQKNSDVHNDLFVRIRKAEGGIL